MKGNRFKKGTKKKGVKKISGSIIPKNSSQVFTAMCLGKCKRTKQQISNVKFNRNPNGSIRVSGVCSKCGTKMNTFVSGKLFV